MRAHVSPRPRGFSLVELMVATAILALILTLILSIVQQTGNAWTRSRSKVEAFQSARLSFENLTRTLGHATLNTYYDYFDGSGRIPSDPNYEGPHHYGRQTELHFVSGKELIQGQITHSIFFQTPAGYAGDPDYDGRAGLLNGCGFYIMHGEDPSRPAVLADLLPAETRYRLMQFFQPSERLAIYTPYTASTAHSWFVDPIKSDAPPIHQLAENIVSLILLPRESALGTPASTKLSDKFEYDSRKTSGSTSQLKTENQLPPMVEVIMVAMDEPSALRLGEGMLQLPAFEEEEKLEEDLAALENALVENHFGYRVFRTIVPLRNSKWSAQ
jgi:uncharacterized protein (TIGR02599 family)